MSVIDLNRATPLGSVAAFRVISIFERAFDSVIAWRKTTSTARALARLSDQQLADIGLHRGDIADVADALARRR